MMKNAIGRDVPEAVPGYGPILPYAGAFATQPPGPRRNPPAKAFPPGRSKVVAGLEAVFAAAGVCDGMTLSFHHHLRNGDSLLNSVLETARKLGIKGLTIADSSIFPVHAPLVDYIRDGTVVGLDTDYISGPVGRAVCAGLFPRPVVLRSHGGRARAIETGTLKIDVAFIAAPSADDYGNLNGISGPAACGPLGYAFPDAQFADTVIAVTDHLSPYPLFPISIPQTLVDFVVTVDSLGDSQGIASGITKITSHPMDHKIARTAAAVIRASGLLKEGFSYLTGAGGASLASAQYVRQFMLEGSITGSFATGGITSYLVQMLHEGLFKTLLSVQSFDLESVKSLAHDSNHIEIGASFYANPFTSGCAVNRLDATVLGATEIDLGFNTNVVTGSNGLILGGSGGHADAAAGAKLTIVVAKLIRKRLPVIVERVLTVSTPGETVDCLVTERGVAVNPRRPDLAERLAAAGLPLKTIEELHVLAIGLTGKPDPIPLGDKVVALVEYRDGTAIDVVRQSIL